MIRRLGISTLFLVVFLLLSAFMWHGNVITAVAQTGSDPTPTPANSDQQNGTGTAGEDEGPKVHVDHREFEILQQEFTSAPEVTVACLSCHENSANEIHQTAHWTWQYSDPETGELLGKQEVINNFCIAIQSNEPRCTSCHTGYGWADDTFDFASQENVDCLVCHDTTGTYHKFPTGAGFPVSEPKEFPPGSGVIWQPPDLTEVALNVGFSSRQTCGSCHFYGGGGDGVKHGDMDTSLANPDRSLDVHMSADGANFACTDCHTSDGHLVQGSRYSMNSTDEETCESCHTAEPHQFEMINNHTDRVACQTCHIPEYARGGVPTKMWWDWSKAGQMGEDGNFLVLKDENGHTVYDGRKGEFMLAEDVVPDYIWFNGNVTFNHRVDDLTAGKTNTLNPDEVVAINTMHGRLEDPDARIWPVKTFRGIQPYDPVNNTLVIPHLFGKDDAAYWKSFEWAPSIQAGMDYISATNYSGQYDFVETQMLWPITHMVAPAEDALECHDCHTEEGGRLDFAALGYPEDEVYRLTHFPPTVTVEALDAPHNSPQACAECHEDQYSSWTDSHHGASGVGCVTCHELEGGGSGAGEGEDQHPKLAYTVNQDPELCGSCHLDEYRDWDISGHAANDEPIVCIDCHEPHTQQQRIAEGNTTSCGNCHEDEVLDVSHSTHGAVKMDCLDCHKNTHKNTGHTFIVESDTCIICHGEEAHTANKLVELGAELTAVTDENSGPEPAATAVPHDATNSSINIPTNIQQSGILGVSNWVLVLPVLFIVVGAVWVVKGKDPGHQHEANQHQDEEREAK